MNLSLDFISSLTMILGLTISIPSMICVGVSEKKGKHIVWMIIGLILEFIPTIVIMSL